MALSSGSLTGELREVRLSPDGGSSTRAPQGAALTLYPLTTEAPVLAPSAPSGITKAGPGCLRLKLNNILQPTVSKEYHGR